MGNYIDHNNDNHEIFLIVDISLFVLLSDDQNIPLYESTRITYNYSTITSRFQVVVDKGKKAFRGRSVTSNSQPATFKVVT